MKNEELEAITTDLEAKLGKENYALISDSIGQLITSNTLVAESLKSKDDEIKKLKSTNEKLVLANGNLLQQVPMAQTYDKHQSKDEPKEESKPFSFRDVFDEKGRFKK